MSLDIYTKSFFERITVSSGLRRPMPSPAASISIEPKENILILNPGDTFSEDVKVKIPGDTGVSKVDVYFLAVTTGSMGGILASVQGG